MKPYHLHHLPAGLKDYLFEEAQRRRHVEQKIAASLRQHGYREIITPTFEHWEVFATAGRNGWQDKIYRFVDREGNLVALRSDFTAQVARLVAHKHDALSFPLRLFYSGKVFRFEELHAGRSRECWQVGFELLGETGLQGDVETAALTAQALRGLQLGEFQINLGTIGYFNSVVREAQLTPVQLGEIKRLLSHKDVDTLSEFLQQLAPPSAVQQALIGLMQWHGRRDILEQARAAAPNDQAIAAVEHLTQLYDRLQALGLSDHVVIDLSEVQGMGYYSGIMIKAYVPGLGYEVGSGGRYDHLLSQFGYDCPAVGFSFDVDRLVEAITRPSK